MLRKQQNEWNSLVDNVQKHFWIEYYLLLVLL